MGSLLSRAAPQLLRALKMAPAERGGSGARAPAGDSPRGRAGLGPAQLGSARPGRRPPHGRARPAGGGDDPGFRCPLCPAGQVRPWCPAGSPHVSWHQGKALFGTSARPSLSSKPCLCLTSCLSHPHDTQDVPQPLLFGTHHSAHTKPPKK